MSGTFSTDAPAREICDAHIDQNAALIPLPGKNNVVFRVRSDSTSQVLKITNIRNAQRLQREVSMLTALGRRGIRVPAVRQSASVFREQWCFFVMSDVGEKNLYERHVSNEPDSAAAFSAMGQSFANLHQLNELQDFSAFLNVRDSNFYSETMGALRKWAADSAFLSRATIGRLEDAANSLPEFDCDRLCHNDFHAVQCILKNDKLSLVDWEEASIGSAIADFAIARANLSHYASSITLQAFINGYRSRFEACTLEAQANAVPVIELHQQIALAKRWWLAGRSRPVRQAQAMIQRDFP